MPGQLGLEPTLEEYVQKMTEVFREVRRVLRSDGTLWLNMGDCYTGMKGWRPEDRGTSTLGGGKNHIGLARGAAIPQGLKTKDLCGQPWRLAFALQADGWVLRSEIVWNKKNPMPESVTDRPTKSHEQIFLFAKAIWQGPERCRFANVMDADAKWLATLVDAEGCIVIKRGKIDGRCDVYAPQVSIGSTNKAFLSQVATTIGVGNVLERKGTNAPMFYWQIAHNIAADFLRLIYPFLIVKQRQARIAIHVDSLTYRRGGKKPERKHRTGAEDATLRDLWERNKACNHFREPDLADVPEPRYGEWARCARYYYDAEAIREPAEYGRREWSDTEAVLAAATYGNDARANHGVRTKASVTGGDPSAGRNKRTVWTIATQPFPEAHFATFPEALVEPCIRAGTSQRGCCAECGAPWVRVVEKTDSGTEQKKADGWDTAPGGHRTIHREGREAGEKGVAVTYAKTVGWRPSCECDAGEPVPAIVFDPCMGSGTTALEAKKLNRDFLGIELSPEYVEMAQRRLRAEMPLFIEEMA